MLIDAFKEIINPDVVHPIITDDDTLIFKESAVGSKIKKLYIQKIPKNAFAFTLDYLPNRDKKSQMLYSKLSNYFNSDNDIGINKSCDLVILFKEKSWGILLLELKSDNPAKESTEKQLTNSELFIKYIESLVVEYYSTNSENISLYRKAVVLTSIRNIPKNPIYRPNMKPEKNKVYYHHARVKCNKEAYVHFNELI